MTRFSSFLVLVLALAISPLAAADEPAEKSPYHEQLERLTIPAEKLPAGCTLMAGMKTASLIGATGNPSVFQDPELLGRIAFLGFALGDGKENRPAGIDAAMVLMYQDQKPANEIGVYALICRDEAAAKRIHTELSRGLQPDVARCGTTLIRVWKDEGASERSFQAVRDYYQKLQPK